MRHLALFIKRQLLLNEKLRQALRLDMEADCRHNTVLSVFQQCFPCLYQHLIGETDDCILGIKARPQFAMLAKMAGDLWLADIQFRLVSEINDIADRCLVFSEIYASVNQEDFFL